MTNEKDNTTSLDEYILRNLVKDVADFRERAAYDIHEHHRCIHNHAEYVDALRSDFETLNKAVSTNAEFVQWMFGVFQKFELDTNEGLSRLESQNNSAKFEGDINSRVEILESQNHLRWNEVGISKEARFELLDLVDTYILRITKTIDKMETSRQLSIPSNNISIQTLLDKIDKLEEVVSKNAEYCLDQKQRMVALENSFEEFLDESIEEFDDDKEELEKAAQTIQKINSTYSFDIVVPNILTQESGVWFHTQHTLPNNNHTQVILVKDEDGDFQELYYFHNQWHWTKCGDYFPYDVKCWMYIPEIPNEAR
jgi:predicted  nucleic acid-binding Zn-ribbon protein